MNLHEFMSSYEPKYDKKNSNLLKQQFLIHLNYVLCKISIIECLYLNIN
jgi:hypothetical protein